MTTVTNAGNQDEEENAEDTNGNSPSGIPRGNTVAVVGDPGTGKTTFLLTYVANGSLGEEESLVRLKSADPQKNATFKAINDLFSPAQPRRCKHDSGEKTGTLRCFISLENNLARVLDNHGALLESKLNDSSDDQFVVIDATAFLSGRLEDRLRYPRLTGAGLTQKLPDNWEQHNHNFNLGGHQLDDDEHFGLYFQEDNQEPKRIDQLDNKAEPFLQKKEEQPIRHRAFNLITRPIPDPFQRVRLLKDLLAEIFVRFDKCQHRILAVDSLSALMNPFDKDEVSASASPARRLNMLNLVRWLEEYGVTTFLACEAEHETNRTWGGQPLFLGTEERYLSSGVIQLNYHAYRSGDIVRYLRVLKMRGAAHDMRPHAYELSRDGIAWVEPLFGEAGMSR